jgi:aminoglycoside phosphotransferase (APT) family kinase protein
MIAEDKQTTLTRALETAFGVAHYDAIEPLAGNDGLSLAQVYRVEVAGRPYLLRFAKVGFPGVDPAREAAFMGAAADVGIAPRIWYADTGVLLTDFVARQPLPTDTAARLAGALRRLHKLPGFTATTRYVDAMAGLVARTDWLREEVKRGFGEAVAAYPSDDGDWVPSHNDLKPPNTLFDGHQIWLVDWEAAFLNDRYVDLAIVANFHANTEAAADAFLAAYFGRPASEVERARFFVMSQIVSVAYVAIFGMIAMRAGLAWEVDSVPAFGEFHRGIVAGEMDLGPAEAKRLYAHVHLERATASLRSPRFPESLGLVAASR